MKSMDTLRKFKISSLAHVINEDVRNRGFDCAHETINESIEERKL